MVFLLFVYFVQEELSEELVLATEYVENAASRSWEAIVLRYAMYEPWVVTDLQLSL